MLLKRKIITKGNAGDEVIQEDIKRAIQLKHSGSEDDDDFNDVLDELLILINSIKRGGWKTDDATWLPPPPLFSSFNLSQISYSSSSSKDKSSF